MAHGGDRNVLKMFPLSDAEYNVSRDSTVFDRVTDLASLLTFILCYTGLVQAKFCLNNCKWVNA